MTPPAQPPVAPAGLSLADALVVGSATVVDLALLERLYLDLVEI